MANKNEQPVPLKIIAYRPDGSQRIYSNYVEVTKTGLDVSIKFCDLKPPANPGELEKIKKEKETRIPVLSEIVLPLEIAKAFLEALRSQLEKKEDK
ncbi:hypothetical protein HYU92_03095 [Candidatus Curtissbacteria bacterium]|nr:hypothetical protein [Candidatus Curtissbacteria bacterium]